MNTEKETPSVKASFFMEIFCRNVCSINPLLLYNENTINRTATESMFREREAGWKTAMKQWNNSKFSRKA